ncbi:MAG: chorismate synthase [Planctomycetes bacterium]|nr:chorismate synthase [Planctomycetota bacterium]MCP4837891.1 chorismate synthase [Planctomycetota bacterium]
MPKLTCHTAGESHGPGGVAIVSGLPAGIRVDTDFVNAELQRRQGGYGRGGRQRIEEDHVEWLGGIRLGFTTGAPVAFIVPNRDSRLDDLERTPPIHRPRPGHADLAGAAKYGVDDCRNILERASARQTAARTAAGALARCMLNEIDVEVFGYVTAMRDICIDIDVTHESLAATRAARDGSSMYCPDADATKAMEAEIRSAKEDKDTLGGLCRVHALGCPMGLGTCMTRENCLDGRLAAAVMSIQAFKSVEIGLGRAVARRRGSDVHDAIEWNEAEQDSRSKGFVRGSNRAGGIEGGMTNGMPVVITGAMKPISTLLRGMPSIDLRTHEPAHSDYERSDVCAVSAASVVMENVVGFEIAAAVLETTGGDSIDDVRARL